MYIYICVYVFVSVIMQSGLRYTTESLNNYQHILIRWKNKYMLSDLQ